MTTTDHAADCRRAAERRIDREDELARLAKAGAEEIAFERAEAIEAEKAEAHAAGEEWDGGAAHRDAWADHIADWTREAAAEHGIDAADRDLLTGILEDALA